jgi:hypothetical protein
MAVSGDVRRASRRSSSVVFDSALVAYFRLLRMAAQACGTPESTALLPGIIAQPPFSTYAACCHASVFFSAVRLSAASALRWNWSTQIGAIAATAALLAVLSARVLAVLPSMNPPQLNPMPSVANAPRAAPCRSYFSDSPRYQRDVGMRLSSQFGEEGFLPSEHGAIIHEYWPCLRFAGRRIVTPPGGRDILPVLSSARLLGSGAQEKLMVLEH